MAAVGMAVGCLQRQRLVRSGHARVLGELIGVAVPGTEVHPRVPAVIDPRLEEDLHCCRPQFSGGGVDVVDQEPRDGAGGEGAVDVTVASKDLDLTGCRFGADERQFPFRLHPGGSPPLQRSPTDPIHKLILDPVPNPQRTRRPGTRTSPAMHRAWSDGDQPTNLDDLTNAWPLIDTMGTARTRTSQLT
jgi:hypothetical protein